MKWSRFLRQRRKNWDFSFPKKINKNPFIEMSGRKGLGVKADDLIDRLEENALKEVETRHKDISDDEKKLIAHQIAVGALRYFLAEIHEKHGHCF